MKISQLVTILVMYFTCYSNTALANQGSINNSLKTSLAELVSKQRKEADLVGIGAMVMQNGKVIASAVDGERAKSSGVRLTVSDKWHIGSITKSFTATMLARLVERGVLNWQTQISDIFPNAADIDDKWGNVTLEQLLTHTAGTRPNFPWNFVDEYPQEGKERMTNREDTVLDILRKPPETEPGSTFAYSNVGLTIAGVIAEKSTGLPWEVLIEQEIFSPLKLQSGGFGAPQDKKNELGQPRGHRENFFGFTQVSAADDDLPPIYGPAGTIHMTMTDLLTYAKEHLNGEKGQGVLLKKDTYLHLHQPRLNNYAYGWAINNKKPWANGPVIWHNGSNGKWYALLAIIPGLNSVIVVTSNDGNVPDAQKSAWEIIKKISISLPGNNN